MTPTNGFVSIAQVIERVYINAGYQKVEWNEALEHIGSIIHLLGVNSNYIDKITNGTTERQNPIVITNYRGELPTDLVSITQCREFNHKYPMVESHDSFHLSPTEFITGESPIPDNSKFIGLSVEDITSNSAFYDEKRSAEIDTINSLASTYRHGRISMPSMLTYKIEEGFIFTNFKEGLVEVAYKAMPTDDNGFPLIRNDEKIIRAVTAHLIERIDYKSWRRGELPDKVYQQSQKERSWAIASARSNALNPTVAGMESIKNMWVRLIPSINDFNNGFKTTVEQERMFNR